MNTILLIILIIIANLVLYWIFFGKKIMHKRILKQIAEAEANGRVFSATEKQEILEFAGSKGDAIVKAYGVEDSRFSKDKLVFDTKSDKEEINAKKIVNKKEDNKKSKKSKVAKKTEPKKAKKKSKKPKV